MMKVFKNIAFVALISMFVVACKNETQPEVKTVDMSEVTPKTNTLDPNAHYAKAEFDIEGMTCAMGCAKTIEKKIGAMEGVKSAKVDFDNRLAMVEYDDAKVTPMSLEQTVKKAGDIYSVKNMKTVEAFSTEKHECKADCKMEGCAQKNAEGKVMMDKKDCTEECKKACAMDKKKA